MMDAVPELYQVMIVQSAEAYFGYPSPAPAIAAQIKQESNWNPKAVSSSGASGLMQFMPATASWAAKTGGFGAASPFDPMWNIRAGTWYMRYLHDRVAGATPCDKWLFALSGFNGGIGHVYERQARSEKPLDWITTAVINPGITAANQQQNLDYPFVIVYRWQPLYRSYGKTVCI